MQKRVKEGILFLKIWTAMLNKVALQNILIKFFFDPIYYYSVKIQIIKQQAQHQVM